MLEISENDIEKSVVRDNPWWSPERNIYTSSLKERAYFSPFCEIALNWNIKRSIILLGPRRVGKTVILHQLIAKAISEGFPPNQIFYASIDTPLYNGIPLQRLIEMFERASVHDTEKERVIIFDEIQYLKDWEQHLKVLTDKYPRTRFIASGSAAAALKLKSQESGAGRFTDFFLPPLTFAEFLAFREREDELIIAPDVQGRDFRTSDIEALNAEFLNYLNYGGYPEAVLSEDIQSNVQRFLGRDIIDKVLLRDLPSLYGITDIQELNRLFSKIAYHSGQEISIDGLSKSSGVAKNTIKKYLDYLEAAFLIVRVNRVDETGKTFRRATHFKAYLTNPSMRSALFSPLEENGDEMGPLVETALFSQWFHSDQMKNLFYARWKKGKRHFEVDLVRVHPSNLTPLWAYEVKWSDRFATGHPEELEGLIEFSKRNTGRNVPLGATSKTTFAETETNGVKIKHFPCALHCYRIGKNVTEGRNP